MTETNPPLKQSTMSTNPSVTYIEGDGVGPELIQFAKAVTDKLILQCYGSDVKLDWRQAFCGEQAAARYQGDWFPESTLNQIEQTQVALIGPITAPLGYGFKSLNVALRHELGLTTSLTRFNASKGASIFLLRDNSEDLPVQMEWQTDSYDGEHFAEFLKTELGVNKVPFEPQSTMALKYLSKKSANAIAQSALDIAKSQHIKKIKFVHQANVLPVTEGGYIRWVEQAMSEYANLSQTGSFPITLHDIEISAISLLQFFKHESDNDEATLYVCSNHTSSVLNDYFTGHYNLLNKVSQANLGQNITIFEPKHGPLHQLTGSDKISPTAILNATASLLVHLDLTLAATKLLNCIVDVEQRLNGDISFKRYKQALGQCLELSTEL